MIYDIAVIGGGALGTCIARDCALRGLSVVLFEREDFGSGATSRLPRFLPAGLRALETLDFTHVREELREREILLQIAPHLVQPIPCLIPFYGQGILAQTRLRASLALTDALGFDKSLPLHQILSASEARDREPSLRYEGLAGAALVWEAHVPHVERLALETALDARNHGACLRSHTQVTSLRQWTGSIGRLRVGGVKWTDSLSGETGDTEAHLVINAAGAWLPEIDASLTALAAVPAMRRKCISVALAPLIGHQNALVFLREDEGRLLFVVPWQGWAWAGCLETEFFGEIASIYSVGSEVDALLKHVREYLPEAAGEGAAMATAGVRISPSFPKPPFLPDSYLPLLIDHAASGSGDIKDGLVSVAGGSLLSCRSLAEETVDLACRKLGRALSTPPCRTAALPLPDTSRHFGPLSFASENETEWKAAVERAVSDTECRSVRDFIQRRSLLFWSPDQGRAAMPLIVSEMANILKWDQQRQAAEIKNWEAEVALTQAFRVM